MKKVLKFINKHKWAGYAVHFVGGFALSVIAMAATKDTGFAIGLSSGAGLGKEGGDYARNGYVNWENLYDFLSTALGGVFGIILFNWL